MTPWKALSLLCVAKRKISSANLQAGTTSLQCHTLNGRRVWSATALSNAVSTALGAGGATKKSYRQSQEGQALVQQHECLLQKTPQLHGPLPNNFALSYISGALWQVEGAP